MHHILIFVMLERTLCGTWACLCNRSGGGRECVQTERLGSEVCLQKPTHAGPSCSPCCHPCPPRCASFHVGMHAVRQMHSDATGRTSLVTMWKRAAAISWMKSATAGTRCRCRATAHKFDEEQNMLEFLQGTLWHTPGTDDAHASGMHLAVRVVHVQLRVRGGCHCQAQGSICNACAYVCGHGA